MAICAYRVNWTSVTGTPSSVTGRPMTSRKHATVSSKLGVQVTTHSIPLVTRIGRRPPSSRAAELLPVSPEDRRVAFPGQLQQMLIPPGTLIVDEFRHRSGDTTQPDPRTDQRPGHG